MIRTPLRKLMQIGAISGAPAVEDTATGNPLTFLTDLARTLKSLLIPFTPIQSGSGDPSPQNVRPIVPWNGLKVWNGGKNLFDASAYPFTNGSYVSGSNGDVGASASYKATRSFVPCESIAGKTVVLNKRPGGYQPGIAFYSDSSLSAFISGKINNDGTAGTPISFTVPSNAKYMRFTVPASATDIQIEVGNTATAYEPYKPITETDISFPSPVYGGEHEAVSGKLLNNYEGHVTTWGAIKGERTQGGYRQGVITFDNEIPVSGQSGSGQINQRCNIAKYQWDDFNGTSHFYTAEQDGAYVARILLPDDTPDETEIVVIAKLKTPVEITLTPSQITALKGENTIWSDADGSMTVTYLKKG